MHRSHLKWLVVLSIITLCIAMFAWRSLGPKHGEAPWGADASTPAAAKVQYVEGDDVQQTPQTQP